jgi:hypothetical protein
VFQDRNPIAYAATRALHMPFTFWILSFVLGFQ